MVSRSWCHQFLGKKIELKFFHESNKQLNLIKAKQALPGASLSRYPQGNFGERNKSIIKKKLNLFTDKLFSYFLSAKNKLEWNFLHFINLNKFKKLLDIFDNPTSLCPNLIVAPGYDAVIKCSRIF